MKLYRIAEDDYPDALATADDIQEGAKLLCGNGVKDIVLEGDHYIVTVADGTYDWHIWIYEYEVENHRVYREE